MRPRDHPDFPLSVLEKTKASKEKITLPTSDSQCLGDWQRGLWGQEGFAQPGPTLLLVHSASWTWVLGQKPCVRAVLASGSSSPASAARTLPVLGHQALPQQSGLNIPSCLIPDHAEMHINFPKLAKGWKI